MTALSVAGAQRLELIRRLVQTVGFPGIVALILLWALLRDQAQTPMVRALDGLTAELKLQREQQDRHTQQLVELLKNRKGD